ncbi:MAG: SPFH/Band 7/PHB domain protein [Candidatus Pacebacteria bacterium]|jgi:hypothetical protein|nr:SPFH/Band 7/PHB domain protein [Candidatus Paceibacterota bacterium]
MTEKKDFSEKMNDLKSDLSTFFQGLLIVLIPLLILFAIFMAEMFSRTSILGIGIWHFVACIIVFAPIVLYFSWAKNNIFGTFIKEGYAVIIVEGDKFFKAMIQYKDYGFDKDWNVLEINEENKDKIIKRPWYENLLGMSLFLWPVRKVYSYDFEWTKITEQSQTVHKSETLLHVLLKLYVYFIEVLEAEDKDNMPVSVGMAVEMKIINPYKALFKVQNWHRTVVNIIQGEVRDFIRRHSYDDLIARKEEKGEKPLGDEFFDLMKETRKKFRDEYGVEVTKIKVSQIIPKKEYLEATTRRIVAERNREAIEVEAQAAATKRGRELAGAVMHMLMEQTGLEEEPLKKLIKEDPSKFMEMYGELFKANLDLVQRQMALDKGGFIDIRVPEGSSNGGLLELVALFQKMAKPSSPSPSGGQSEKNSGTTTLSPKEKKKKDILEGLGL